MAKNTIKKGRLSNIEAYYIHGKMGVDSVADIAKELGRSESIVQKYIDSKSSTQTPVVDEKQLVESKPVEIPKPGDDAREAIAQVYKGVNMKDAIKRARVRHKGRKTGVVATEEMSGKADSSRDQNLKSGSRLTEGAIFKPHGEEGDYDD